MRDGRLAFCALMAGTGCSSVFGLDKPIHDDGGSTDGNHVDAGRDALGADAPTLCASASLRDSFAGGLPCTPWGSAYHDAGVVLSEASGLLSITPASNASVGGCLSGGTFPFGGGATVIVNEVIGGSMNYTDLMIHPTDLQIKAADGLLRFQTSASTDIGSPATYNSAMRWWRMRPTSSAIVGEYSTDGVTWSALGTYAVSPPTQVSVELTGGTNTGVFSGKAVFDELVVCP